MYKVINKKQLKCSKATVQISILKIDLKIRQIGFSLAPLTFYKILFFYSSN